MFLPPCVKSTVAWWMGVIFTSPAEVARVSEAPPPPASGDIPEEEEVVPVDELVDEPVDEPVDVSVVELVDEPLVELVVSPVEGEGEHPAEAASRMRTRLRGVWF